MIQKISSDVSVKHLTEIMKEFSNNGYVVYLKAVGNGDIKLIIELPIQ